MLAFTSFTTASNLWRLQEYTGYTTDNMQQLLALPITDTTARQAMPELMAALTVAMMNYAVVIISGNSSNADTQALLREAQPVFMPNRILMLKPCEQDASSYALLQHVFDTYNGCAMKNSSATAYVCSNGVCSLPITDVEQLRKKLKSLTVHTST
jgi:uncharacterized protein YyaL (SSP411 family)